jgi:hypothetical protein
VYQRSWKGSFKRWKTGSRLSQWAAAAAVVEQAVVATVRAAALADRTEETSGRHGGEVGDGGAREFDSASERKARFADCSCLPIESF